MKRILFAAAALSVLASSYAMAQAVVVSPEQRTTIKRYVTTEKIRPYKMQSRVTVGATLPADVELSPVPETWGPSFRSYRYVYTGDDVVLVDPSSRRVIDVID
jgi:Ni/Co efflux regulator RcnB